MSDSPMVFTEEWQDPNSYQKHLRKVLSARQKAERAGTPYGEIVEPAAEPETAEVEPKRDALRIAVTNFFNRHFLCRIYPRLRPVPRVVRHSVSATDGLRAVNINLALRLVEEHEMQGCRIILHPKRHYDLVVYNETGRFPRRWEFWHGLRKRFGLAPPTRRKTGEAAA